MHGGGGLTARQPLIAILLCRHTPNTRVQHSTVCYFERLETTVIARSATVPAQFAGLIAHLTPPPNLRPLLTPSPSIAGPDGVRSEAGSARGMPLANRGVHCRGFRAEPQQPRRVHPH